MDMPIKHHKTHGTLWGYFWGPVPLRFVSQENPDVAAIDLGSMGSLGGSACAKSQLQKFNKSGVEDA